MKMLTNMGREQLFTEKGLRHPAGPPAPPHERRALLHIEFCDKDILLLEEIFGDADTAAAAEEVIQKAPPEIQILALQLIDLIEEVRTHES